MKRIGRASASEDPVTEPASRRWWVMLVIASAMLTVVLNTSIIAVALPSMQKALEISDANRPWVVTAYMLAYGSLLVLGGRIADYGGTKRALLIALIGFAAASAACGAAQSAVMLIGARAVQGAFAALLVPAALSLISVTFIEPKERARAFAIYGVVGGAGTAAGTVLGGALTQYTSWRWCFLINVPIAAVAAIAGSFLVTESRENRETKYDLSGAVLSTAGLLSLVLGFTEAATPGAGWVSLQTLGYLGLAVLLLAAFVVVELYSASPLLPLRIILDRCRGGSFIVSLLLDAATFSAVLLLTFYLQDVLGLSPVQTGIAFLPYCMAIIIASGISARLVPKIGARPLMVAGLTLTPVGLVSLTFIGADSNWYAYVLPGLILMGVGAGLVFAPLANLVLSGVEPTDAGIAGAVLSTTQQVGGSLGWALLSTLYANAVSSYLSSHHLPSLGPSSVNPGAATYGYHVAFWIGSGMVVVALIAVLVLVPARVKTTADPDAVSLG